jgi:plastocyanin
MRHWLVLGAVYLVVAALVLPGSLFAAEDPVPAPAGDAASEEPAPPAEEPAAEDAATAPPEAPPGQTAPAPPPAAPVAPAAPEPAAPQTSATAPAEAVPNEQDPAAADAEATGEAKVRDLAEEGPRKVVARAAATGDVVISDFEFTPHTVRVVEGDTVVWSNDGPTSHSATAKDGSFDTGVFAKGGSRQVTFDNPGTFAYYCTPHPFMKGTVVVQAASANTGAQEKTDAAENADTAADQGIADETVSDASLPSTGNDVRAMIILALVMVAIGTAIQLRTRRQS